MVDLSDLSVFKEDMQVVSAVKEDGTIEDWDLFEKIWQRSFNSFLKVDTKEPPVLFAEKPYNSPSSRSK